MAQWWASSLLIESSDKTHLSVIFIHIFTFFTCYMVEPCVILLNHRQNKRVLSTVKRARLWFFSMFYISNPYYKVPVTLSSEAGLTYRTDDTFHPWYILDPDRVLWCTLQSRDRNCIQPCKFGYHLGTISRNAFHQIWQFPVKSGKLLLHMFIEVAI